MNIQQKPDWLKIDFKSAGNYSVVSKTLKNNNLHTICVSGRCPNLAECWSRGTATFMILGEVCTRSCKFCNTLTGKPLAANPDEPNNVANAVKTMNLRNVVLTSVSRDDLQDGGAEHWAKCILSIKNQNPEVKIETLIPDFRGDKSLINKVIDTKPNIISHNIETVKRLTPAVRSAASFETSLAVLQHIYSKNIRAKSGLMLGLGETETEIFETMDKLLATGCEVLTLGQYLQPTKKHLSVVAYIHPDKFAEYKQVALQKGFRFVESGALVRSSYHAENCMI
ncbi:MAG: lipoyl synthase [Prevotellaceae bacterium]|jgi:lipoic acid synthetase|nr:lipoyl synthase [Prevotellaceae bacterium]